MKSHDNNGKSNGQTPTKSAPACHVMPEPDERSAAPVPAELSSAGAGAPERPGKPGKPTGGRGYPHYEPGLVEVWFDDSLSGVLPHYSLDPDGFLEQISKQVTGLDALLQTKSAVNALPSIRIDAQESQRLSQLASTKRLRLPHLNCFVTFRFPSSANTSAIAAELRRQIPGVVTASPVPVAVPPSDPLVVPSQLVVQKNPQNQWYLPRCGVDQAWSSATGEEVVIADVDFGFQIKHRELKEKVEATYNAVDDGDDVTQGQDTSHGTSVAALAAAARDSEGMQGVAYDARLWLVQANEGKKNAAGSPWAQGIDWARARDSGGRRKVILLEVQTYDGCCYEQLGSVNAAIIAAIASDIVVVVPAGNGMRPVDVDEYGGLIADTGSILVGSTDYTEDTGKNPRSEFSNYGERIAVSAPGDRTHDVTAIAKQNSLTSYSDNFGGTSGAAAKVAGAVALMLDANNTLTPEMVRELLIKTGTKVETDPLKKMGVFLNAAAAVTAAANEGKPLEEAMDQARLNGAEKALACFNTRGRRRLFALIDHFVCEEKRELSGERVWSRIGGWFDDFVVVSGAGQETDLIARAADRSLYHSSRLANGDWSAWDPVGGRTDRFAAIRHGDGELEIFARGGDGHLYRKRSAARTWSTWEDLQQRVAHFAVAAHQGNVEIFATDEEGSLRAFVAYGAGAGWSSMALEGRFDHIRTFCEGDNVELYARSLDGMLFVNRRQNGMWIGWQSWDVWADSVEVAGAPRGTTEVYIRAADGRIHRRTREQMSAAWSDWQVVEREVVLAGGRAATASAVPAGAPPPPPPPEGIEREQRA